MKGKYLPKWGYCGCDRSILNRGTKCDFCGCRFEPVKDKKKRHESDAVAEFLTSSSETRQCSHDSP